MKIKFTVYIILSAIVVIMLSATRQMNFSQKDRLLPGKFIITGKAYGFKDSTMFYLEYDCTDKSRDSGIVVNGHFVIKGVYPDKVPSVRVILRTKDYSDYKYFWLDGLNINFSGTKGNFNNAKITGSAAQQLSDEYSRLIEKEDVVLRKLALEVRSKSGKDSLRLQDSILMLDDKIIKQHTASFIYNHKNSIVSVHLLDVYCQKMGKKKTTELYNRLSPILKETHYGLNVKRFIDLNKEIKIGDKFADIEQKTPGGVKIKLSESVGKYTLLEFWASWCGPCLRENPELVKLYNQFRPKGFEIYAVSVDESRTGWIKAIEKDKLPWINISELNGTFNSAVQIYGVYEYPTNFLINPDGKIIAKNLRGKQLEEKLTELFTDNSK